MRHSDFRPGVLVLLLLVSAAPLASQQGLAADSAWNAGELDRAAELYEQRLASDPVDVRALHRLALIRGWGERHPESLDLFGRLLRVEPDNTTALLDRARVLAWSGDLRAAIEAADAVLALEPGNRAALEARAQFAAWAGGFDASLADYDRLLEIAPGDRALRLAQARVLGWADRYDAAGAVYTALLEEDPEDRDALLGYAQVLAWSGRNRVAAVLYERILAADPGDAEALRGRARVASWSGRLREGEARWHQALAADSTHVAALVGLATVQRWRGRNAEARATLERAAALEPENDEVLTQLSWVHAAVAPRFAPTVAYEGDSDGNRIVTSSFGFSYSLGPRLRLRADAYVRSLGFGPTPELEERAQGGTLGLSAMLGSGWTIGAGAGGSASSLADQVIPTLRASVSTPGDLPFGASAGMTRGALDATAQLVRNGIELTEWALDGRYTGPAGLAATARLARAEFRGSQENHRTFASVEAYQRVGRPLSIGASIAAFAFERDLHEGYFDPEFFGIALVGARWNRDFGRWNTALRLGSGVQQVGSDGRIQGAADVNGRVAYTVAPGRDVGISAGFASRGLNNLTAQHADYRYRSISLSAGWAF